MTQGLDLLRAAAHEGDALDLLLEVRTHQGIVWLEVAPQASQW